MAPDKQARSLSMLLLLPGLPLQQGKLWFCPRKLSIAQNAVRILLQTHLQKEYSVQDEIEQVPFWSMLIILRSCSGLLYHNARLFSTIADYAASAFYMWDIRQVILFLSAFENLGYRPVTLMNTFAEKVTSQPDSLNIKDVLATLRAYSLLNHIPEGQEQQNAQNTCVIYFQKVLSILRTEEEIAKYRGDLKVDRLPTRLSCPRFLEALNSALTDYLPRIPNEDLLKAVYSFCILGYHPQPALDQLLQDEVLQDLITGNGQKLEQNEMMLRSVNLCLELEGHSVPRTRAAFSVGKSSPPTFSYFPEIQEVLLTLLGDASLFRPKVKLGYGYNIDFEILMDANRTKVVPSSETDPPTDDPSVQRVAVLCVQNSAFCFGSRHPRGRMAMKMRHLRLLGYHVVLVHYLDFQKLEKEKAVQFLKGEIFSSE